MNCTEVEKNLHYYMDGELQMSEADAFKKHLSLCPECDQKFKNEVNFKNQFKGAAPRFNAASSVLNEVKSYVITNLA